jgi:glutamyl-tRNA synthetase
MAVVTRFAPSPTGFLHIGGARTALFNWLYARGRSGKMLLRIEDTDRERSTQAAIDAILDGLNWLGIGWDGEVVYQFARAARHREVVEQLLATGNAYRCYASPDELKDMRETARREGRSKLYDGRWRDRDQSDAPPGVKPAIRLKAPLTGETVIDDQVQGRVVWQNENLDDLVLLRSDGTPTYMLAVVVDDHDMDVTHIIRGDDHLTNAARQKQIYDALGWAVPVMAHIPLIHGPDGSKLSKRHGALGVDAYRAMGYLPVALRNYLVRLGWAHGDQEIFSTEEMIAAFDLPQIGRSPARFDFAKLESLNGHYIRQSADADLLAAIDQLLPHIEGGAQLAAKMTPALRQQWLKAMPSLKERAKTLLDLIDGAKFLWVDRPIPLDDKAKALLTAAGQALLKDVAARLAMVKRWTAETTEREVRILAEDKGLKLGAVAQPLRAALTGRTTSPGIFEVLHVLGKSESLARLEDQVGPIVPQIRPSDRLVRQISPRSRKEDADEARAISNFADCPNIVLLGDPGAGKSHTFRQLALASNAQLITARAFLVTPVLHADEALFIDGLDERRAGRGDRDTVDALVEKLFAATPKKVRISCRVADWLGESDLAAFRPFFEGNGGEPVVLLLERLSPYEQRMVLVEQGLSHGEAVDFITEAQSRGLSDFLENPQNLILLLKVVGNGQWPTTRRALFEMATTLLLQESNAERARAGGGIYSVAELRSAAGGLLAARLISDIEAISLSDQEGSAEVPSYRSFDIVNRTELQAVLGRRVFGAGPASETVDYTHRTTAEYLGAAWLTEQVRGGLPLGRVQALIGIDGHPAPELRGLHAWLAVHLREYADQLIDADPYGVLTYGDAASLTRSSCARLLQALARLSEDDPWFRSGDWQAPSIGALSRADMTQEFQTILRSPTSGFAVRSIVLEALATGTSLASMRDDLIAILVRHQSTFAERLFALRALIRIGAEGEAAIVDAYGTLGCDDSAIRLRAEIIETLYDRPFGPAEIVQLLKDTWSGDGRTTSHMLYTLAEKIPIADAPAVLDGIPPITPREGVQRRSAWDVAAFYERVLIRVWDSNSSFDPDRALKWLEVRRSMRGVYTGDRGERLRAVLSAQPERLRVVADRFLLNFVADEYCWLRFTRFREATLFEISADDLLDDVIHHLNDLPQDRAKETFLYEAALSLCHQATEAKGRAAFDDLYYLADTRPDLGDARTRGIQCVLPTEYFSHRTGDTEPEDNDAELERLRAGFAADAEGIRVGENLDRLTWAAMIYFALFNDVEQTASPRERLVTFLGPESTVAAVAGFKAVLERQDLPSFNEVLKLIGDHKRYNWWFVILAGMDEAWSASPDLDEISDDLWRAILAFDLTNPIPTRTGNHFGWLAQPWKQEVFRLRPNLVREAYSAVARLKLNAAEQYIAGLHELLHDQTLELFRSEVAIEFLRDFPNAPIDRLRDLLDAALKHESARIDLLSLARRVMTGTVVVDEAQRDAWLAVAFLLSPVEYEKAVEARARIKPGLVFELRSRTGFSRDDEGPRAELPLPQLEFLARLTGSLYPLAGYPPDGWSGNTNPWDASDYVRSLANVISANPSTIATLTLERLAGDPTLASYRQELLHSLAAQEQRRRDAEYDRPDWPKTVNALGNGPPATVADLHALLVAHLRDEAHLIARANTDNYKAFWNVDSYGKPTTPRPEEVCRDTLADRLRTHLAPLGISVEPEGHMVGDKRADISVAMPGRKVLTELKRDYHADVWTAAEQQLDRFYVHDPEAGGFGIYGVFWFGEKRPSRIPAPPGGRDRPDSAEEMESMLRDLMPPSFRRRIAVVVIDVSGPR